MSLSPEQTQLTFDVVLDKETQSLERGFVTFLRDKCMDLDEKTNKHIIRSPVSMSNYSLIWILDLVTHQLWLSS